MLHFVSFRFVFRFFFIFVVVVGSFSRSLPFVSSHCIFWRSIDSKSNFKINKEVNWYRKKIYMNGGGLLLPLFFLPRSMPLCFFSVCLPAWLPCLHQFSSAVFLLYAASLSIVLSFCENIYIYVMVWRHRSRLQVEMSDWHQKRRCVNISAKILKVGTLPLKKKNGFRFVDSYLEW